MQTRRNFIKYLSILPLGKFLLKETPCLGTTEFVIHDRHLVKKYMCDRLLSGVEYRDKFAFIIQNEIIPYLERETGKKHEVATKPILDEILYGNLYDDIGWSFDFTNDVVENKRYDIINRGIQLFADNIKEKLLRYNSDIFYNLKVFDDLHVIKQKQRRVGFFGYCTIKKNSYEN